MNRFSKAKRSLVSRIENGNFRYCVTRSNRKYSVRRWSKYKNEFYIKRSHALESCFGIDSSSSWVRIVMGNIMYHNETSVKKVTKRYKGYFSTDKLNGKFYFDNNTYSSIGFEIDRVYPSDLRRSYRNKTADYSYFYGKFYFPINIEDYFRKTKRNSFNSAKLSRNDLTYKKNESGDYFISLENGRYSTYLGRVWKRGGSFWVYQNFLDEEMEIKEKFSKRKNASEKLYQELRD